MSLIGIRLKKQIRELAVKQALKIIAASYKGLRERTPVITGYTQSRWRIIVDGIEYESLPTKDQLKKAKKVEIRNLEEHISTLDKKYAIIALTKVEIDDLLRSM